MLSGHPPFYGKCGTDCGWEKGENCKSCQVGGAIYLCQNDILLKLFKINGLLLRYGRIFLPYIRSMKLATFSVKIVRMLYCRFTLSMSVYKIWRVNRDKQHWEDEETGQKWKNSIQWKCLSYFCLRLWLFHLLPAYSNFLLFNTSKKPLWGREQFTCFPHSPLKSSVTCKRVVIVSYSKNPRIRT